MPQIRYYTVTQERQVKVRAHTILDAAYIATSAFNDKAIPVDIEGSISEPIRELDLVVREEY